MVFATVEREEICLFDRWSGQSNPKISSNVRPGLGLATKTSSIGPVAKISSFAL
jgi:hypothetical protein